MYDYLVVGSDGREYSSKWEIWDEPYYLVNSKKNEMMYKQYRELTVNEKYVIFGGRLGEYKNYDMDAVIIVTHDSCKRDIY